MNDCMYVVRLKGKPKKVTHLAVVAVTTAEKLATEHSDVVIQVQRKVEK